MAKSALNNTGPLEVKSQHGGVPVLMYHGIAGPGTGPIPNAERKYWIPVSQLTAQLEKIVSGGYLVAPLCHLWWLKNFPQRPLALTFDDGHASDYTVAYPLLQEFGFRADFFINTASVGTTGYLTWNQIREMHKGRMSIQSHGHEHVDLSRLSPTALSKQLEHSKKSIEDQIGRAVEFLSVPFGLVSTRVITEALAQGYRAVCTSRPWPAQMGETEISRMAIHRRMSSRRFESLLAGSFWPYATACLRQAMLYLPKQVLLRHKPAALTVQVSGEAQ